MSARVKGRKYRSAPRQSRGFREQQLRDLIDGGEHEPSQLAVCMGCSKELVMYYAKSMDDIELRSVAQPGRRPRHQLYRTQAITDHATTERTA